jgi:hypothetical protein
LAWPGAAAFPFAFPFPPGSGAAIGGLAASAVTAASSASEPRAASGWE